MITTMTEEMTALLARDAVLTNPKGIVVFRGAALFKVPMKEPEKAEILNPLHENPEPYFWGGMDNSPLR